MPVSATQHRTITGTHQNKLFENNRGSNITHTSVINRDSQHVQRDFPLALTHVGNSPDAMSGPTEQLTLGQSSVLLGLQLLSQIHPADNPLSAASGHSAPGSGRDAVPSCSRNAAHSDNSGSGFSTILNPVASALYETGRFIERYDPLRFPGADASESNSLPLSDSQQENDSVNHFLLHRDFIHVRRPERVPLIKTLNGVARYLEVNPGGLPLLAGKLPGGGKNGPLSEDQARIVLYRWLSDQVLGMDPERWLEEKMYSHVLNAESSVGELEQLLTADAILPHNKRHSAGSALKELWQTCVRDAFPLFAIDGARNMLLHDIEWGLIHAGSLVLKEAGLPAEDIDAEAAMFVGNMYLTLLQEKSLPEGFDGHRLFRLKALLDYARRHPEEMMAGNWTGNQEYITGRADRELLKAYEHHLGNNVVARFSKALSHWKTRRQVTEELLTAYRMANPGRKQYTVEDYMNENFRGGRVKDNRPPFILPVKRHYAGQTSHVANCFAELDKPLVTVALASPEENESAFIQDAEVKLASARVTMPRPPANAASRGWDQLAAARQDAELLPNVDLFAAFRGNEERIYALKGENGSYTLHRVDHNKDSYFLNGLMTHSQENNHPESQLSISIRDNIKSPSDGLTAIVDNFVQAHRETFYKKLYEQGYEKTAFQEIRDFLPSLIPFYDCTKSIQSGDDAGAAISCTLDVLAFIPALGEATSLAGRFASSAAKATLRAAGRTALNAATRDAVQNGMFRQTIKRVGREALRGISVPTKSELLSVGKAVLQGIDPGVELLVDAGKLSKSVLTRMAKGNKNLPPSLKKLFTKLEGSADELAPVEKSKAAHAGGGSIPELSAGGKLSKEKDASRGIISGCHEGRLKRSLDDICVPAPVMEFDPNGVAGCTFHNRCGATGRIFPPSVLKKVNPARHEILSNTLSNLNEISNAALKNMEKMTDDDLGFHFFMNTMAISSAADIRKQISELDMAVKVFNSEFETRFLISDYSPGDESLLAEYSYDHRRIILNINSFTAPNVFTEALLHEISHSTGTKDYFYYNLHSDQYPPVASYESERAMLEGYIKKAKEILTSNSDESFRASGIGQHSIEEFNVPESLSPVEQTEFVAKKVVVDRKLWDSVSLNNADTLSIYLMSLANLGEGNIMLKDTFNIFSTSEAKEFSKYGRDWEAHL